MRKKRFTFHKGAGEMLGMAITLPLLMILIFFIINLFQITACEQKLIYATYFAGRAAVLCKNQSDAKKAVDAVLQDIYPGDSSVEGTVGSGGTDNINWVKGNVINIAVKQELHPIMGIGKGEHCRVVAIMIEHSDWELTQ